MKPRRALPLFFSWICLFAWLAACQAISPSAPTSPPASPMAATPASIPSARPVSAYNSTPSPANATAQIVLKTSTQEINPPILLPFPPATVKVESVDVWDDPQYENVGAHLQTQLILGEQVLVLQSKGDWAEIRAVEQPSRKDALGYPGWVRRSSLIDGWPTSDHRLVVMVSAAPVYAQPQSTAVKMFNAPLASSLVVAAQTPGWVSVKLPDGRTGWIESSAARLTDPGTPLPGMQTLLEIARSMVGVPYVWGGTAPAAYDCSGFVYRVFSAGGIKIARDSQDQALQGQAVDPSALQPGDLLFYAAQAGGPVTHVALYAGGSQVFDAQTNTGIQLRSMAELLNSRAYVTARRLKP